MTIVQEQFFALVRAGLWGTEANASLFPANTNWEELYRCARAQTMLGIVFDGVQTLPASSRPPRALYLKWCNALMQIEENNLLLNRELANIYTLCREQDIDPILLKGQGVAQNYRVPLHRQCGDIDLFPGESNYRKLEKLLCNNGAKMAKEETFEQQNFHWRGITIENHRIIASLNVPLANRRLQKEIKRWFDVGEIRSLKVGDCTISAPPLTFDAVYILMHSLLHALNEGIGLRQVCDWTCLHYQNKETLDKPAVQRLLANLGLENGAHVFGAIAVKYLGLPQDCLPFTLISKDYETADWLLQDIWESGNFGFNNTEKKIRPKGYWRGKWYTLMQLIARCRNMKRLSPAEARWYPIIIALHSIQIQLYFRIGKYL